MRPTVLMFCLVLAGCAGANANTSAEMTGSTPAAATAPSPVAREAQASDRRSDKRSDKHEDERWMEGGVTREKINAMCWMKYENGRRDMPVEKRADLVDECVQQTLKEHPLR
jgi:hypothetical protein